MRYCGGRNLEKLGSRRGIGTLVSSTCLQLSKEEETLLMPLKQEIREHLVLKFKKLFSEETTNFPADLDNLIEPVITKEDNRGICKVHSEQEIRQVVFDMQNHKALGPDGLPALFYKKFLNIVGRSVVDVVQGFFRTGNMHYEVNNSLIVLIPKTQSPSSFKHFRLISLCNIVYKIISKLIVARLRPLLHKMIAPNQWAFIPGK